MNTREIAEIFHEALRGYQAVLNDAMPSAPWWCLDSRQQAITMYSVEAAKAGATPERLWRLWRDNMIAEGWRYGEDKDPGARTHPNLVDDWNKLPEQERAKDRLLHAIVAWAEGRQE